MRVVIAPDNFTGTLTAAQAAAAIAEGWLEGAPHDEVVQVPLSDGGPGFLDVIATGLGDDAVESVIATVEDPLGRPVPALVLIDRAAAGVVGAVPTAYIESAQAIGLHLLDAAERDPTITSTYGVGQLIEVAIEAGAERIVIGLGGSGTNDGGAGMLAALGAGDTPLLRAGGAGLIGLADEDLAGLEAVTQRLSGIDLVAATDVTSPLLGLQGASAVFAAQKGATPEQAQELERALGRFHEVVSRAMDAPQDLLTGRPVRLDRAPGAGAAGGLGYALLAIGARRVSGVELVIEAVGLREQVADAALVVTGEGTFDWQSMQGKVVAGVAQTALEVATPSIVIAGQVTLGRREAMSLGLSGMYAVAESPAQVEAAMLDPVGSLRRRTARVARTWSPRRPPAAS
ncbi:MAG: glycerate kinase [Actinomycetales bacterium]|nr:glycerate kinase [Tetrasphaera sp.]NLX00257.1 glycerate kinase [Actinomycetales bacterium]